MNFIFSIGNDISLQERTFRSAVNIWGNVTKIKFDTFLLVFQKDDIEFNFIENEKYIACIDGWAGNTSLRNRKDSLNSFFEIVKDKWPIENSDFSGCFSGFLFDKIYRVLKIFSDVSGIYPLYYYHENEDILGGTSLIVLGKIINSEIDLAGVIQRISPPYYVNFGTRTILKDFKQVLPGEMMIVDQYGQNKKIYDNSLFSDVSFGETKEKTHELWNILTEDISSSILGFDEINVGLSGGWDSRIVIGSLLNKNVKTTMYTYGLDSNEYEVRIAESSSKVLKSNLVFCNTYENFFPVYEDIYRNLKLTEASFVTSWFPVLKNNISSNRSPIILGDMFEVITGKSLVILTSRASRKKRFFQPKKYKESFLFPSNPDSFSQWAANTIGNLLTFQLKQLENINPEILEKQTKEKLIEDLKYDLSTIMSRISSHNLPYTLFYDELFGWYNRGKSISRQFLCLKEKFYPLASSMGFRSLRYASNLDPFARADNVVMHEIQKLPELRKLSRIPSAAIPFIPSNSPLVIKNLIWGFRSMIDQQLIKKGMNKKDKNARFRVLKTENLVKLYNHPEAENRVNSYFKNSKFIIGDYYVNLAKQRAELDSWPLINLDIMGPASTSILLNLLKENCEGLN
jgi:hypothetical protein